MANGFGSFFIGASGLQNAQTALNTTANNLANVNTMGYVRQQVRFGDRNYITVQIASNRVNAKQTGLGVTIADVVHARDIFLDKAYRQESGRQAFYENSYQAVVEITDMFQEMNGQEFKQSINDFYVAFQELSKAPEDSVDQNLIVEKASLFLTRTQDLYSDLQIYQSKLNQQIKDDVDMVNKIGNRIYELNLQIQKVEAANVETAMTLRDERDYLLDQLSQYGSVDVLEDFSGFVYVDFENQVFIDENRCYNIGLNVANGTGFATPYWPQLSNYALNEYVNVFRTDVQISSEFSNDLGKIKAELIARGDGYGHYYHLESGEAYSKIDGCTVMETQAEIDRLFHTMITQINDLLCPNITVESDITDGTTTIAAGTKILDVDNCSYGVDKELPPQELFTRIGCERYTKVTVGDQDYYVYNEELANDTSTQYITGSVEINNALIKQVTKLPVLTKNGAVNMELGAKLAAIWEDKSMCLNPLDTDPCTFTGFYDKMLGQLAIDGSTYYSQAETTADAASSVDFKRQQITGVSSDEELTKMVKYQAAYNASSRFINVINEMTELIVALV